MSRPSIALRLALAAALALPLAAAAQAPVEARSPADRDVVLDGRMDEWEVVPAVFAIQSRRAASAYEPAPRYPTVERVKVRHDADAVYLQLTLDGEFALQALPGTLVLALDEDADPATGWDRHGMQGVDAEIEFSSALGPDGARMGTGLRLMHAEGRASCLGKANVAGVMAAPSHASRVHEVRIPRGDVVTFGARMRGRLVSLDSADLVIHQTEVFTADLADAQPRGAVPGAGAADPLARAPGTDFRVVSWNVGRETFFQQPDGFGAVLRPLAPDLLMLDEVGGGHTVEEVESILNRILPGDRPWRAVYGASGGSQRGVIAVRGPAPRAVVPFAGPIPYPEPFPVLPSDAPESARDWLRSRLESHVPATGAIVEIGGRKLLAVTVDLESGGGPGSPKDNLRRTEASAISSATEQSIIGSIREEQLHGIIIAGDFNLVGTVEPLEILLRPVSDGAPMVAALPLRLDGTSAATWENPEEAFTPGRLDYVLYHPVFMQAAGGFVFRAADLSPEWRARHGLAEDASAVTDHLPIVTDLRWLELPR